MNKSYRLVRAVLRWLFVIIVTLAGGYFAISTPLLNFLPIPDGLRVVFGIELVGLTIVAVLEITNRLTDCIR
jgi:hypothetical protein